MNTSYENFDAVLLLAVLANLLVIGSAIWCAADAARLGACRGRLGGGFFDMGPRGWFWSVLLVWLFAFRGYLITRAKLTVAPPVLAPVISSNPPAGTIPPP